MEFTACAMEYQGGPVQSSLLLQRFDDSFAGQYISLYNEAFLPMRKALGVKPYAVYASAAELEEPKEDIFLLVGNGCIIGSVALRGNEIDDLFLSPAFQGQGFGRAILLAAVAEMQQRDRPISHHVADWNQRALSLYQNCGFIVTCTETIIR